jgi:hypothetical protein
MDQFRHENIIRRIHIGSGSECVREMSSGVVGDFGGFGFTVLVQIFACATSGVGG